MAEDMMGREVKRVPLDFDWPLHEVWDGFQNPFHVAKECPHCQGSGLAPDAKRLHDQWYGNAPFHPSETGSKPFTPDTPVIRARAERNIQNAPDFYGQGELAIQREARRLCDHFNNGWIHHLEQIDVDALVEGKRLSDLTKDGHKPTAQEVNEWSLWGFGHDSINNWICVKAKCARLGYAYHCEHCDGDGEIWPTKAAKMLYDAWEDIEPPMGDGWQVWETVTEGSPISPVFDTDLKLVEWLIGEGYTPDAASSFVKHAWSPSMMMIGGQVKSAIECMDNID